MQVLLYQPAYERVAGSLATGVPAAEPLVMASDGSLTLRGAPIAHEDAAPEVAWANRDVYDGGPVREFMVHCLKSQTLRFVQSSAAGFEHPVFSALVDKGIRLANSDASSISIAEFVLASVLAELHPGAERRALQAERRWDRRPFREIHGQRWVVVGVGGIGREVVLRAQAFGARVTGVRRTPRGDEPCPTVALSDLDALLPEADVLVISAPANPESHRLLDAARLARLKPGSLVVNVSRGALVDETALLAALDRGAPAAAILDVFDEEPLPGGSPLWSHPRVRVTPHDAANGDGFTRRSDALFLRNLAHYAAGEPLERLVPAATVKASLGHPG